MDVRDTLRYFAVLVSFLPKFDLNPDAQIDLGILDINKKKTIQNRTFIYGSWAPLVILKRMNDSRDPNILAAAIRACETPISVTENIEVLSTTQGSPSDIYGIMCIIGPIKGLQVTKDLVQRWEKLSRGPQPRTVMGYQLARAHGYEFSVNFPLFFQLNPHEVRVELDDYSMENGSHLSITPLVKDVTCVSIVKPKTAKKAAVSRKRPTREPLFEVAQGGCARKRSQ